MSWNYRIMRHKGTKGMPDDYGLHEVFYTGKKIGLYTEDPMIGHFKSKADLIATLTLMLKDAKKRRPILEYKD